MPTDTPAGHCLCHAIAFTFDGPPNWVAHCHCEDCRRATSSPMTTWISVPRRRFRYTRGTPRSYLSSPGVSRAFCGTCGSPLTYENTKLPDEVHLYAVTLEDPADINASRHVFVKDQLPWFETTDALPRYAATSLGGTKPIRNGPAEE